MKKDAKGNRRIQCRFCKSGFKDGRGATSHVRNRHHEFYVQVRAGKPIAWENILGKAP